MDLKNQFADPPPEFRGVALWMLNDRLTKEGLCAQLEAFHAGGWGAVIARTFPGLLTEYLSEEYMDLTRQLVQRARELGMRTWLQAAYMPGAVPGLPEDIQYRGVKVEFKTGGDEKSRDGLTASSYGGTGEGFTVIAEDANQTYSCGRMPEVLDLLNGEAVTEYLDKAYKQPWYDHIGAEFGKTIEAIWVDEPHFRPQLLPWSVRLPATFKQRFGYDLTEHIPSLFTEAGDWQKVRHQYWRTIVEMFMAAYFTHVGGWCREHGVKFAGHLMGEDSLMGQIAWTGATMQAYEHIQLPGIDHLTMDLTWPLDKKFILTPKQATSVANQLGKEQVLAEVYAVSSHRLTFRERKRIFNWMAVLGINTRCVHAAYYSLRGRRKRIYVPPLGREQPWWTDNRIVADYCARLSWFGRQGYRRCDVLVLHPQESAFCLYDPRRDVDRYRRDGPLNDFNTRLIDLCDHLLSMQRDFEFGDEALMAKHGSLNGHALRIGRSDYRLVVLPDMLTIRQSTLALLNGFADGGGAILSTGVLPERVDGVRKEELPASTAAELDRLLTRVVATATDPASLSRAVDAAIDRPFAISAQAGVSDVWTQLRVTDGHLALLLVNTSQSVPVTAELKLNATGRLERWDLETGEKQAAPCTAQSDGLVTPLHLAPDGAALWVLALGETARYGVPVPWIDLETVAMSDRPKVRRLDPNAMPLDIARYRRGDGDWSGRMATVMIQKKLGQDQYHGTVTVEFTFEIEQAPRNAFLAIENPENHAIRVNGKDVNDTTSSPVPYYIDPAIKPLPVASLLREGTNVVELRTDYRAIAPPTSALQSQHEARDGSEIEAITLIGDFAVTGGKSRETPATCLRYTSRQITAEPTHTGWDLADDGYPFFAGRVILTDTVSLRAAKEDETVWLALHDLQAPVARVRVNGREAGYLAWEPLEVEITPFALPGDNTIEIEFASGLRNVLGPFHRMEGEPDSCWRNAWDNLTGINGFEHADEASIWTDDYFVIHLGTTRAPAVVIRRADPSPKVSA